MHVLLSQYGPEKIEPIHLLPAASASYSQSLAISEGTVMLASSLYKQSTFISIPGIIYFFSPN